MVLGLSRVLGYLCAGGQKTSSSVGSPQVEAKPPSDGISTEGVALAEPEKKPTRPSELLDAYIQGGTMVTMFTRQLSARSAAQMIDNCLNGKDREAFIREELAIVNQRLKEDLDEVGFLFLGVKKALEAELVSTLVNNQGLNDGKVKSEIFDLVRENLVAWSQIKISNYYYTENQSNNIYQALTAFVKDYPDETIEIFSPFLEPRRFGDDTRYQLLKAELSLLINNCDLADQDLRSKVFNLFAELLKFNRGAFLKRQEKTDPPQFLESEAQVFTDKLKTYPLDYMNALLEPKVNRKLVPEQVDNTLVASLEAFSTTTPVYDELFTFMNDLADNQGALENVELRDRILDLTLKYFKIDTYSPFTDDLSGLNGLSHNIFQAVTRESRLNAFLELLAKAASDIDKKQLIAFLGNKDIFPENAGDLFMEQYRKLNA